MAAMESKILPGSYPMNGGDGKVRYARNSQTQRRAVDDAKKIISEAIADLLDIENLTLESSNRFQIADLGCATGPNTFYAVENIIEAVANKYKTLHKNPQTLEYQVFFSDRIDNDFNTLFRSFPFPRPYFAVGVPGSFYGRLFPAESIHFMHSSNSLNWLSRVPNYVGDINSPAWNGSSIYCRGDAKEVAEAYSSQYKKDMETFLNARAQELVVEGLMALVLGGRQDGVPLCQTNMGKTYDFLGSCLFDMATEGIISKEKVESLNLPQYYPSISEIEELINTNGCFCIEKMETFPGPGKHFYDVQMWSMIVRAGFEAILQNHFGSEMVEDFFERYAKKHADNLFMFDGNDVQNLLQINIVLKPKVC
ncbi:PREDICTED: probable S-adenosylmethionine-dependent methyltransferase At5g37990 [Theobroma cacao]|uniref:Probable S-adenosylmethionine-dependent methyltransferase At5g37990 n=1 Tax=Theobroma cacao TaxID=3641 RepID=A0AB32W701_THECC|nr:PREDICTED: probable S-adenosylmethionine-dependent methyltransferase At5g37990 [Theobroma cacao]